jgi:heme-degrading monooxygenase HmoA
LIARIWKGAVRKHDGDAYAEYMRDTGIAGYACTPGNRGVWMLRRDIDEHTEFLMFTLWDSLDAVKAFAGQDYETAVFCPEDGRFLVERDTLATHYVVDTHIPPSDGPARASYEVGRGERGAMRVSVGAWSPTRHVKHGRTIPYRSRLETRPSRGPLVAQNVAVPAGRTNESESYHR